MNGRVWIVYLLKTTKVRNIYLVGLVGDHVFRRTVRRTDNLRQIYTCGTNVKANHYRCVMLSSTKKDDATLQNVSLELGQSSK